MSDDFEPVLRTHDGIEAEMAFDLLEENGLHPRLMGTNNAAIIGAGQFALESRIEVPADEVARATEVLETLLAEQESHVEKEAADVAEAEALATPEEIASGAARARLERPPEEPESDALAIVSSTDPAWGPLLGITAIHAVLFWATGDGGAVRLRELGALSGWPATGELYRLVTASFLHFDLYHLLSNTEGLLLYGWAAIRLFGLPRAAAVYMAAALVGGVSTALAFGPGSVAAGASGCVFALIALVLAGKLQQARRATMSRGRGYLRVMGWALFALPPALYFNFVAHLAGVAVGIACGLALAPWTEKPTPRAVFAQKIFAGAAIAIFALAWTQRLAAQLYAPCITGALERCQEHCDRGEVRACFQLGLKTWNRESETNTVPRMLLSRACDSGLAESCGALGALMRSRPGQDDEAIALLRRACTGGNAQGCVNLAWALLQLDSTHDAEAIALARQQCEAGVGSGCSALAWAHLQGRVEHDDQDAAKLLRQGCDHGDLQSCRWLASMLAAGDGVREDREAALSLYAHACRQGDRDACDELRSLQASWYRPGLRRRGLPQPSTRAIDPLRFL